MRGGLLGEAYVRGYGRVRVFEDLERKDYFYILGIKHDRSGWKHRDWIQWRKVVKK